MKKLFTKSTITAFILGLAVMYGSTLGLSWIQNPCTGANVGVVTILGEIDSVEDVEYYSTSAPDIVRQIGELEANPSIKGILLDIDSGGGAMESSESIMLALKGASKPTGAVIRNMGASGAFLAATGADRIFASRFSDVGSIGVTNEFIDTSEQDRQNGVIFYDFSSGIDKGALKPGSKLTQAQREVIMEDVVKLHDIFVWDVAQNRGIPLEKVKEIATGRSYVGEDALELGLVDQIGGLPEAMAWLRDQIGEEPSLCYLEEWVPGLE